jgi:hypothetical protein
MNLSHPFPWASLLEICQCQNVFMGSAIGDSSLSPQMTISPMLNETVHQQIFCAMRIMKQQLLIYRWQ